MLDIYLSCQKQLYFYVIDVVKIDRYGKGIGERSAEIKHSKWFSNKKKAEKYFKKLKELETPGCAEAAILRYVNLPITTRIFYTPEEYEKGQHLFRNIDNSPEEERYLAETIR